MFEATSKTLHKVKISGGGRCNVLHDPRKGVTTLLAGYPRGSRELSGLYHKHFTPDDAHEWFVSRGVELKVEPDGRCFPVTDSSQTIMNTLLDAAHHADVNIRVQHKVSHITRIEKDNDMDTDPDPASRITYWGLVQSNTNFRYFLLSYIINRMVRYFT